MISLCFHFGNEKCWYFAYLKKTQWAKTFLGPQQFSFRLANFENFFSRISQTVICGFFVYLPAQILHRMAPKWNLQRSVDSQIPANSSSCRQQKGRNVRLSRGGGGAGHVCRVPRLQRNNYFGRPDERKKWIQRDKEKNLKKKKIERLLGYIYILIS